MKIKNQEVLVAIIKIVRKKREGNIFKRNEGKIFSSSGTFVYRNLKGVNRKVKFLQINEMKNVGNVRIIN